MKSKRVEFTPPEEVLEQIGQVPAGTRMDLMASFAVKDNGRWCITAIEGVPMPGYDGEGNPTDKEEHLDMGGGQRMADKMNAAMASMGGNGGAGEGGY